jgi:hypothetical protein
MEVFGAKASSGWKQGEIMKQIFIKYKGGL